jgi:hypothetical protein
MKKPLSIVICCLLLTFGVSLLVAVEDAPETKYDESEQLPYQINRLFSVVLAPKAGATPEPVRDSSDHKVSFPSEFTARVRNVDTQPSRGARLSSLLCVLLC